jgi:hypothetical protein
MLNRQTVLVCPLDWGLGHASRMIPVINRFIRSGFHVILGGSGKSGELLKITFPDLIFIPFPSPIIRYGKGRLLWLTLMKQLPGMIISVYKEHNLMKQLVKTHALDIVVSDNRYGLFCPDTYTIFVTHQISPVLPLIFRWLEYPLYLLIKKIIHRYDECWIPDFADTYNNLSGKLSHRFILPQNARYIGILSRFSNSDMYLETVPVNRYDMAVVLSGPEPQISKLEKLIQEQVRTAPFKTIIINGLRKIPLPLPEKKAEQITVVSHLEPQQFCRILSNADAVICRSGYSGIMDLIALGKSAFLVPTPGQTEQKYLAVYLSGKGWFHYANQDELNVVSAWNRLSVQSEIKFPLPVNDSVDLLINFNLYKKHRKDSDKTHQEARKNL